MPKRPIAPEKLAVQLRNLKLARRSRDSVSPSRQLRWAVYQVLLRAAGVDPVTLEWDGVRYTAEDIRERLVKPLSHAWDYLHAVIPDFPPRFQAERSPIYALGNALRCMFGITHLRIGKHEDQRYIVDTKALTVRRDLLSGMHGIPSAEKIRRRLCHHD